MLRPSWLSAEELRESLPFLVESQMQISKHVLVATHLSSCPPFESNSAVFCWADLWQRNPATGYRVGPLEKITWTLDRKQSIISIYAKCITRFLFLAMVSETGKEKSFFCLFVWKKWAQQSCLKRLVHHSEPRAMGLNLWVATLWKSSNPCPAVS